jgi:L-iditol 2-dehydrogenase
MNALVKKGLGLENVVLMDISEPEIKENEIKIKVHAAGICGTDLHIIADEYPANYPVVMGHEYSGTVVEVGSLVEDFSVGDKVVSLTAVETCGKCSYCYEGLLMLCENRRSIGSGVNGAFAEYLKVPEHLAFTIPKNVSMEEAVLSEPLACMVRCVIERGSVKAGDDVLISGPGTIGLLTMQLANISGGRCIVLGTSHDMERLELAKELGAAEIIVVDKENASERIKELTNGKGVDVAFECAGVEISAQNCLKLLKKTGLYVQVGLFPSLINFDMNLALTKEVNITNGYASERTSWVKTLKLLEEGKVKVSPLISTILPIEEWAKGVEMSRNKTAFKVLLKP